MRADPGVSVHFEPVDRPQLPFYAQLQQLHHAGHSGAWVSERHPAGGMAHRPVQSLGQMGLRPSAGSGKVAQRETPSATGKAVFHTAQAKGGKIEVSCAERSRVSEILRLLQKALPPDTFSFACQKRTRKAPATFEAREARTRGYSPLVTPILLGSIQKIQAASLEDFLCSADFESLRDET